MDYLVHHMLRSSVLRAPDDEALADGERRSTFAQAAQCVENVACGLRDMGVGRFDRVGVFLGPSPELALSLFAISTAGGAFVPIHPTLFPPQVEYIIRDCGMVGLITGVSKLAGVAEVLRCCTSLRFGLVVDDVAGGAIGEVATVQAQHAWGTWASCDAGNGKDTGLGSDLAAILYTSGSTGRPKGVMLSHANIIAGASIVSEYLQITRQRSPPCRAAVQLRRGAESVDDCDSARGDMRPDPSPVRPRRRPGPR